MKNEEQMMAILNHIYWFYNANMSLEENQKDFKESVRKLENLIKGEEVAE
jgi:hypothetical protein